MLDDVFMNFKNINIDSTTQYDTTRFLYAKEAIIRLNNYALRTPDSLYSFKADSLDLNASEGILNLTGLSLTPRVKKEDFSKKLSHYKDRYDIRISNATFKNIDWYNLLAGENFAADEAELNNATVEVFADKNLQPSSRSKVGNYPHQMLMKLTFPVRMNKIKFNNFNLTYKEVNPKTKKTGTIVFNTINGIITNLTNIKEDIANNKFLKINTNARLMGDANIKAAFVFDLSRTATGAFSADAELGPMNGKHLNIAAMPLGSFEINSLNIKQLKAHVQGDNNKATGSVFFIYDDLKITVLKLEDNQGSKGKKSGFLTFG